MPWTPRWTAWRGRWRGSLDAKVDGLDERMREQRQDMKAGFERVKQRFERHYCVLIFGVLTLSSALIAGFTGLIVAGT
jgi:hypothetical protein